MPKEGSEVIDIDLYLHHEMPTAILVSKDGQRPGRGRSPIWLPKSKIEYVVKKQNLIEVTLPTWLAFEKGLI